MTRRLLPALLVLAAAASPLAAQRAQLELGGSSVSIDSQPAFGSIAATGLLDGSTGGFYGAVVASGARFEDTWLGQARLGASALLPLTSGARASIELAGTGGGSILTGSRWYASTGGVLRLHWQAARTGGLWVGAMGGVGDNSTDSAASTLVGPQVGGWMLGRKWSGSVTAVLQWYGGRTVPEASTEVMVTAGPFDFAGWGGVRGPVQPGDATTGWIGANAVFWIGGPVALSVSAASYPDELLQGVPAGSYISAAVRIATRRLSIGEPRPTGRPSYVVADRSEIRVTLPGARAVELAGDWTAWKPVPLVAAGDGTWRLRVQLPPGTYRFAIRSDGGEWTVPPGIPSQPDGFGGRVALLVVE